MPSRLRGRSHHRDAAARPRLSRADRRNPAAVACRATRRIRRCAVRARSQDRCRGLRLISLRPFASRCPAANAGAANRVQQRGSHAGRNPHSQASGRQNCRHARPGHVGHGRKREQTKTGNRGAAARPRARHVADRHRRDVCQRRRRRDRRRSLRRTARRGLHRQQGAAGKRDATRHHHGVRAQPEAAQHRPDRPLSAALARPAAACPDAGGVRDAGQRRQDPRLGRQQFRR